jgi:hypothetical protein
MLAATSAVTVEAFGNAAVDCRRASDAMRAWAMFGASAPRGRRVAGRDTPPAACGDGAATAGSAADRAANVLAVACLAVAVGLAAN